MSNNIQWITDAQQPASWRGLPFVITNATVKAFRNVIVQQYPYKNYPNMEDMGRAPMEVSVQGYISGPLVYFTQQAYMSACSDIQGPGMLIHPNLGAMNAYIINASFAQTKEAMGVVSLSFTFIIGDQSNNYAPSIIVNTQGLIGTIIGDVSDALNSDLLVDITNAIGQSVAIVGGVISTIGAVVGTTNAIMSDAAGAMNAVRGVGLILGDTVTTGRYANGKLTSIPVALSSVPTSLSVSRRAVAAVTAALAAATTARALVKTEGVTLNAIAQNLVSATAPNFTAAVQTIIGTLTDAIPDPADQIRLLNRLAAFQPISTLPGAALAAAVVRRAALNTLANAISNYQPTSSTDAEAIIDAVDPLFDNEIEYSADQYDEDSYRALKSLRTAVISDLQTRGSQLPELIDVTILTSFPAKTLAYWFYGDANRADELVQRNNPIHPLFMDLTFEALSS